MPRPCASGQRNREADASSPLVNFKVIFSTPSAITSTAAATFHGSGTSESIISPATVPLATVAARHLTDTAANKIAQQTFLVIIFFLSLPPGGCPAHGGESFNQLRRKTRLSPASRRIWTRLFLTGSSIFLPCVQFSPLITHLPFHSGGNSNSRSHPFFEYARMTPPL